MNPLYLFFHRRCIFILFLHINLFSADLCWQNLPLLTHAKIASDSSLTSYLFRYGLDTIGSTPVIGTFKSDSFICVGQIYKPLRPSRGTVIFLHGLFDHVGTNVNGIDVCLKENYTVAAFDLPGHGLSSGVRGEIGDFHEYAAALHSFMRTCETLTNPPYIFIGHSTGCAVALEYVTSTPNQPFTRMIFLAPLVRSSSYRLSYMGYKFLHRFKTTPRRWLRKSTHDKESLKRVRNDPLQPAAFSMQWAGAYFRWVDSIKDMTTQELPLVIIQGTKDKVVDWKYNLRWFERKIKGLKVVKINGARHHLLKESLKYRLKCFETMRGLIRDPN